MCTGMPFMPKPIPISHRDLARKLIRAGYVEIRTSRHPVYYLADKINSPTRIARFRFPNIPAMFRRAHCAPSLEMGMSVAEFNAL